MVRDSIAALTLADAYTLRSAPLTHRLPLPHRHALPQSVHTPPLLSSIATAARILYTRVCCSVFSVPVVPHPPTTYHGRCGTFVWRQGPVEGLSPHETGVVMDPVPVKQAWHPACNGRGVSETFLVVAMSSGLTRVGVLSFVPSFSPTLPASLSLLCRTALLTACRTFSTRLPSG